MCDYHGCVYNVDDECCYESAAVKCPAARACTEEFDEEDAE